MQKKSRTEGKIANAAIGTARQVTTEERQRMIAEVAYYRALNRGFADGDPADDWLAAESEVNRTLLSPSERQPMTESRTTEPSRAAAALLNSPSVATASKKDAPNR
jgi:hypothetical protein